jgi:hypothetical protein
VEERPETRGRCCGTEKGGRRSAPLLGEQKQGQPAPGAETPGRRPGAGPPNRPAPRLVAEESGGKPAEGVRVNWMSAGGTWRRCLRMRRGRWMRTPAGRAGWGVAPGSTAPRGSGCSCWGRGEERPAASRGVEPAAAACAAPRTGPPGAGAGSPPGCGRRRGSKRLSPCGRGGGEGRERAVEGGVGRRSAGHGLLASGGSHQEGRRLDREEERKKTRL